jgi:hypothetical protein
MGNLYRAAGAVLSGMRKRTEDAERSMCEEYAGFSGDD